MARLYEAVDAIEPISDSFAEIVGSAVLYNVVEGCGLTYDATNMTVDLAAGMIVHNGKLVAVSALANAFTVVSDPTNPRWTWLALSSAGAAEVVSGAAAAVPGVPELGDRVPLVLLLVQAAQTIANDIVYKIAQVVSAPAPLAIHRWKSATQPATTTVFADMVAAVGGTFSFAVGANEVWEADYWITSAMAGNTGGQKFQITGPAAPTSVDITGEWNVQLTNVASEIMPAVQKFANVTAFATPFAAANAANAYSAAGYYSNTPDNLVHIKLRVINGATAGTVTLQVAQNSANGTTTFGLGCYMRAERIG